MIKNCSFRAGEGSASKNIYSESARTWDHVLRTRVESLLWLYSCLGVTLAVRIGCEWRQEGIWGVLAASLDPVAMIDRLFQMSKV